MLVVYPRACSLARRHSMVASTRRVAIGSEAWNIQPARCLGIGGRVQDGPSFIGGGGRQHWEGAAASRRGAGAKQRHRLLRPRPPWPSRVLETWGRPRSCAQEVNQQEPQTTVTQNYSLPTHSSGNRATEEQSRSGDRHSEGGRPLRAGFRSFIFSVPGLYSR